jgi:hypothetical protein
MSVDESDGRINSQPDNDGTEATQRNKNDRGRSGQATPVERPVSNDTYSSQSHKFTERTHRSGLRRADNHASWREVYRACHVGVGHE